jgi:hypothetical protein
VANSNGEDVSDAVGGHAEATQTEALHTISDLVVVIGF